MKSFSLAILISIVFFCNPAYSTITTKSIPFGGVINALQSEGQRIPIPIWTPSNAFFTDFYDIDIAVRFDSTVDIGALPENEYVALFTSFSIVNKRGVEVAGENSFDKTVYAFCANCSLGVTDFIFLRLVDDSFPNQRAVPDPHYAFVGNYLGNRPHNEQFISKHLVNIQGTATYKYSIRLPNILEILAGNGRDLADPRIESLTNPNLTNEERELLFDTLNPTGRPSLWDISGILIENLMAYDPFPNVVPSTDSLNAVLVNGNITTSLGDIICNNRCVRLQEKSPAYIAGEVEFGEVVEDESIPVFIENLSDGDFLTVWLDSELIFAAAGHEVDAGLNIIKLHKHHLSNNKGKLTFAIASDEIANSSVVIFSRSTFAVINPIVAGVPEPSPYLMLMVGLGVITVIGSTRNRVRV